MDYRDVLPKNTILDGKYRIERVLGAGGFGITYEATDIGLEMSVAIKEYYPTEFALRDQTQTVRPRSEKHRPLFDHLRTSFLREAQTLAQFEDPSIVRVISFFPANGTAYMVMRYEVGSSVKAWLAELGRPPTQAEIDRILVNILRALELMHSRDFLHRDIATDNIILRPDGHPVLLDFGSSRRVIAETTGTLTGIIKQGFSPPEQYQADSKSQGPWTDIYALGATLYQCVTGGMPPESMARVLHDDYVASRDAATSSYRAGFLQAIDWSLEVHPKRRPQNVVAWRAALLAGTGLERDAFLNPSNAVYSRPVLSGAAGDVGGAHSTTPPPEATAPSRPSLRSRRPSAPIQRPSGPPDDGAALSPAGPGTGPPRRLQARAKALLLTLDGRKAAGLAAAVAGFMLVGTMILFGFSPTGSGRRADPIVAPPGPAGQQVAAIDTATRNAEVERARAAALLRRQEQEEASRQRAAAEAQSRAEAEAAQQRQEIERLRQADEAKRQAEVEAERQRLIAEAERQRLVSETQKETERLRRAQLLDAPQREAFLKELQRRMKANNCYDGDINGQESDVLRGLATFRRHDSSTPEVVLAEMTVAGSESLLAWLAAHPRPVCQGPAVEERQLEQDRIDKERAARRQQDAERARQRAIEEKAQQREAERTRQRERSAAAAAAERRAADRASAARGSRSEGSGSSANRNSSGSSGNAPVRVPSF